MLQTALLPMSPKRLLQIFAVASFWLLLTAGAQAQELSARVDRSTIGLNETLTLTLELTGTAGSFHGSGPDLQELRENFEVLSNRSSRQMTIVNGQTESRMQWTMRLAPLEKGALTIPALEINGAKSQPITVTVEERERSAHHKGDQPFYVETEIDKDSIFVQEQLLFTVRLYSKVNLDAAEMQPLELDNAVVKAVDENNYITKINNQQHLVLETRFALFPQKSGELVIPPLTYDIATSPGRRDPWGSMYSQNRQQRLRTEEQRIQVQPRAPGFKGEEWLPAKDITLSEHWSQDPESLVLGEPVTRRITLKAEGLTVAQLPELPELEAEGVRFYPDQPQTEEAIGTDGVSATVTQTLAMVPNKSGRLTLPPIELRWWDTDAGEMRTASLPEREIQVTAPAGYSPPQNQGEDTSTQPIATELPEGTSAREPARGLWYWLPLMASLLLICALVGLGLAYWRVRRELDSVLGRHDENQRQARIAERSAWGHLKRQVRNGHRPAIRSAVLNWARAYWPNDTIHSLADVIERGERPGLTQQLEALDASLYSPEPNSALDPAQLLRELDALRVRRRKREREANELNPLYIHS